MGMQEHSIKAQVMLEQWRGLVAAERVSVPDVWPAAMSTLQTQMARLRRDGQWVRGPSDLLTVVGEHRRELAHSRALAWLLDPVAAHRLGVGVLDQLLARLGVDPTTVISTQARTACETYGGDLGYRTFADVIVTMPDAAVVFENKLDAAEQSEQCKRLVDRFDGTAHTTEFVYLTPDGRAPTTAGPHLTRWHTLTWAEVAVWLERAIDDASDPAPAAGDYLTTLKERL